MPTYLLRPRELAESSLLVQANRGRELKLNVVFPPMLSNDNEKEFGRWVSLTVEMLSATYDDADVVSEFEVAVGPDLGVHTLKIDTPTKRAMKLRERTAAGVNVLDSLRERLLYAIEPEDEADADSAVDPNGAIFVVHGHNGELRESVARMIDKATTREPVVLHEQANQGQTLIEKFERHGGAAAYAVVLLTADDRGREATEKTLRARGRQNVVFEMGFFYGKIGRERVAVLLDPGVEKPSDSDGIAYITRDGAGAWKRDLAREFVAAGIDVDYAQIP